jgi:predicted HD phosphohydrolase
MKRGGDKLALWVQDWAYQGGNQNPYIEEQTTQWSKEEVQKDKQQCTNMHITLKRYICYLIL